ncbi:hypothetical protein WA158_007910 [Blastocystis sp. Blastoise]
MKLDKIIPKRIDNATIEFVRGAFDQKINGNGARYEMLKAIISTKKDINALVNLLEAINNCLSYFESNENNLSDILTMIFSIRWELNLQVTKSCCNFAVNIASINGKYYASIYSMLIHQLIAEYDNQTEEKKDTDIIIHETLQSVIQVAPLSAMQLAQTYQDLYPHSSADVEMQTYYLRNVLETLDYCPMIRERCISVIIEKLTAIDVEIRIDDRMKSNYETDEVFAADWDNNKKTEEDYSQMAEKLDQMMGIMFEYINKVKEQGEEPLAFLFHTLQRCFERSVMLTHKSKHVQFLLFYICQYNKRFIEQFIGRMIDWICSEEAIQITRQTCAAYCASFVCRALYIELDVVKSVLYYLIHWVKAYIDIYQKQENPLYAGSPGHTLFYSVIQSVCYILCFCGRRIARDPAGMRFLRQWNWKEIMDSSLEPLRYCISSVTTEFIYLAIELKLINFSECQTYYINYLYNFLYTPDLENQIQQSKKVSLGSGSNPLDSFFPFDPYLLRDSYVYIKDIYISWEEVVEDDEDYVTHQNYSIEESDDSSMQNDIDIDHDLSDILEASLTHSFMMSQEDTQVVLEHSRSPSMELDSQDYDIDLVELSFTQRRKASDVGSW